MEITINCRLSGALANELRAAREHLTRRWFERIAARVALDPQRIFPTDELLDHVPILVDGIAGYLEDPADEITAHMPVIDKAMELGELRFSQGFAAEEILKEYEILGGVLFSFLVSTVDGIDEPCTRGELLACAQRLFRAISVIQSATTLHYLTKTREGVSEREERLRGFNRTVSHELKNRIGAVLGAGEMLREKWIADNSAQRERFVSIVVENARGMQQVLEDLIALSHTDASVRQNRNVLLPQAVAEAARQLREAARARGVMIRIRPDIPPIEVNAAAVELCLVNYLSNAIKYSDPGESEWWVDVSARLEYNNSGEGGCEVVVRVRDNGLGVPPEARDRLFERFFRAHAPGEVEAEGTGLGLSIVRETAASIGGRAWAEFDVPKGSVFALALPYRRGADPSVSRPAILD